jgi:hypothetical protein
LTCDFVFFFISTLLLLLLYLCPVHAPLSRPISASPPPLLQLTNRRGDSNPLLSDAQDDGVSTFEDKIDELDIIEEDPQQQNESEEGGAEGDRSDWTRVSGNFFDHLSGAIRKAFRFNQRSINEWVDDRLGSQGLRIGASEEA